MKILLLFSASLIVLTSFNHPAYPGDPETSGSPAAKIITGAEQLDKYLPYLKGKRVGLLVNQTSVIGKKLIVDSLLALKVNVTRIFGPEHGFRANASNGAHVADEIDPKTGIAVISLYGSHRKPSKKDMDAIDVMIFDIQDVGCRFYTYINTLRDIMEVCNQYGKELIILDRPNPNGFVDGPVLDMSLISGIGQFPVPITHGMTMGEFAQMINGEGWMTNHLKCKIIVIPLKNYTHEMEYTLPVSPSPNLNTQQSILLYPSLCLFEGTIVSQGRGTNMPFTVLGSPALKGAFTFSFTPVSMKGMSETPLHQDSVCYGLDLRKYDINATRKSGKINIRWMMDLYQAYPNKAKFFDYSQSTQMLNVDRLAGTTMFKRQIIAGKSEAEIRRSWEPGLSSYKKMREQYMLYK